MDYPQQQQERRMEDNRLGLIERRVAQNESSVSEGLAGIKQQIADLATGLNQKIADLDIDLNQKIATATRRDMNWGWFCAAVTLCISIGYMALTPIQDNQERYHRELTGRLDRYYTEIETLRYNRAAHDIEVAATNAKQTVSIESNRIISDLKSTIASLEAELSDGILAERIKSADMVAKKARDILLDGLKEKGNGH